MFTEKMCVCALHLLNKVENHFNRSVTGGYTPEGLTLESSFPSITTHNLYYVYYRKSSERASKVTKTTHCEYPK